jgi:DivIVA domain-containing protein
MSLFDTDTDTETLTRRDGRTIRGRRFARVRRGFDPDQVRDFLDYVANWIEQLETELRDARQELDGASRRTHSEDPYGKLGSHVAELVRGAEEAAARTRRESEEEANRLLASARQEAEKIRVQALSQSDTLVGEARTEAERLRTEAQDEAATLRSEASETLERAKTEAAATLAGISGRKDELLSEMRDTRVRLAAALDRLDDALAGVNDAIPEELEEPDEHEEAHELKAPAPSPIFAQPEKPVSSGNHAGALDPSPLDPWALGSSFDRDLFAEPEEDVAPIPRVLPGQALFDDTADFDLSIPDIPLIEDPPDDEL